MKNIVLAMLSLIALLGLSSCTKQIQIAELRGKSINTAMLLGGQLWYCGSDTEYHYFSFEDLGDNQAYRLNKADLSIRNLLPTATDRKDWKMVRSRISSGGHPFDGLDGL
ncbi:MAG: hypothetical protein H0V66_13135 [Bdellovibrionales bacterium]|nr:hypothetical protein [Bdellovibrionales bacterium]